MNEINSPLVSAIITTHNRFHLVEKAIDSVLQQTYPNLELIVVDDASNDGTDVKLNKRARTDGFQYIYIPPKESKGGNYARNLGIQKATGDYIALLDDDDEWMPEKTERQMEFLRNNPDYGVVSCLRLLEYDFNNSVQQSERNVIEGDISKIIFTKTPLLTSTLLFRKKTLEKCGLFDENLAFWQDYELSIRYAQITKVGVVHEYLCLYRIIKSDKNRLTNKLEGWKNAVSYINTKHEVLINKLPRAMYEERQLMIAKDGKARATSVGDKKSYREFQRIVCRYNPTIKNWIIYIIGLDGLNTYRKIKCVIQNKDNISQFKGKIRIKDITKR